MDTSTTIPPVRFVRCPNCRNVLRENPEIPVYKCGGCGITLKAKHHVTTIDGVTSSASLCNDTQNVSNPNSFNMTTNQQEKEKDSDSEENGEEQRLEEKNQFQDEETGKIQSLDEKTDKIQYVDEKAEKPTQPSPISSYCSSMTSENAYITIENDTKYAPESPFSHFAGSSSFDSRHEKTYPDKLLLMSRRTFRQKKILDSEEDSVETESKIQSQNPPEVKKELPAFIHSIERDNTFGSEDYHSVQNWNASDLNEVTTKPQSRSFRLQNSEPDGMKILRKVDELRDDLSEYLAAVEEKKDMIQKQNLKPKTVSSATKSYCRPVYNGAPFVVCYKCRKLLQLPADFLVTMKQYHKLKCGSCSQVLLFSFRPKDYLHGGMSTEDAVHPPSEVESSVSSSYNSRAEKKLNVSRNSSYSVRQSRLHRLMGYSSASELLFVAHRVNDGYESTEPGTPSFFRPQSSVEVEEEDEEGNERLTSRRRGSALKGLLKKGARKLKIHSNV